MAPPDGRTTTGALDARQGAEAQRTQFLANVGRHVADEQGLDISQNRLNRLVRRFVAERRPDIDFRYYFLGYADPTGERAVRNIMRGSRG